MIKDSINISLVVFVGFTIEKFNKKGGASGEYIIDNIINNVIDNDFFVIIYDKLEKFYLTKILTN